MEMQYFKWYSHSLNQDMECKVYGHAGQPMLFVPCQDGRFFDFENYKMTETWRPWIESGKVMVISIDTIDKETWSDKNGDKRYRIERHEQWFRYIVEEVAPLIRNIAKDRNGWEELPGITTFGCSLGALHAVNLYFRWPTIFTGMLALSGIYSGSFGFDDYMDDLVYQNSPVDYLNNMPYHHPYVSEYNNNHKAIICVGQGPWEMPETTFRLRDIINEKGIDVWVDVWGHDVEHDWPSWHKQVAYFAPHLFP